MKSPILRLLKQSFKALQSENIVPSKTRRTFVKQVSVASIGTLLTTEMWSCKTKKDIRIAIIGGGIAGDRKSVV